MEELRPLMKVDDFQTHCTRIISYSKLKSEGENLEQYRNISISFGGQ